jgi:hypothetical protein
VGARCPPFAAYCSPSGLPRLHGTTLAMIPGNVRIFASTRREPQAGARMQSLIPPNTRRVGIVWAGRPAHNNDCNRSATLAAFAPPTALRS